MNTKVAKKIRQMHRREVRKIASERVRSLGSMIRPQPKWCPTWLWSRLIKLVIQL